MRFWECWSCHDRREVFIIEIIFIYLRERTSWFNLILRFFFLTLKWKIKVVDLNSQTTKMTASSTSIIINVWDAINFSLRMETCIKNCLSIDIWLIVFILISSAETLTVVVLNNFNISYIWRIQIVYSKEWIVWKCGTSSPVIRVLDIYVWHSRLWNLWFLRASSSA